MAARERLRIEFVEADYLDFETDGVTSAPSARNNEACC